MKKFRKLMLMCGFVIRNHTMLKIFNMARLTVFLILAGIIQVFAVDSYSQSTKLTLNFKDTELEKVLGTIEDESEFFFLYNKDLIDVEQKVDIDAVDKKITEILDLLLEGKNIKYFLFDRQIVLSNQFGETGIYGHNTMAYNQQQRVVSGKITDSAGQPLPGVSIVIKGTTQGTVTDANGNYTLSNLPADATLVFSFVGMRTQEVFVGNRTSIDVLMEEEAIGIDEVVAIGYGTQKKINLTGAVTSVPVDQLSKKVVSQASQLLQGTTAGVTVRQSSGNPGDDQASFWVRGIGTFSGAGVSPLIIVDGFPGSINSVNPNDIESISILKDAASAAIYGSRAANGVILITTKSGKKEELTVTYESYIGKQEVTRLPEYLNSWEFAEAVNEIQQNEGSGILYSQAEIDKFRSGEDPINYPNKDHMNDLFNSGNGLQTKHNLIFSGGSGNTQYFFSMGYLKQNGIVQQNYYDQYNLRLNIDSKLMENLNLNVRLSGITSVQEEPIKLSSTGIESILTFQNIISKAHHTNATVPGRLPDGTYGVFMGHPTAEAHLDSKSFDRQNHTGLENIVSLDWDVISSVKLSGKMSYRRNFNNRRQRATEFEVDPSHIYGPTQLRHTVSENQDLILESLINYDETFGDHYLHVLGGYNQQAFDNQNIMGFRADLLSPELEVLNAGATGYQKNSGGASKWRLRSFFGRINYSFKEKYFLEGNIRYDGSSRFAEGKRYGLFPSFSVGWRISEEDFFQIPWIDQFKIRISNGILGNQQIGTYPYQKVLSSGLPVVIGGQLKDGIRLAVLRDENLSWETTNVANMGVDITVLNGKLNFIADYFYKKTYDILYQLTVSDVLGMNVNEQNAGEVENKGWDFELVHKNTVRDFSYSINSNFSVVHNKLLKLANVQRDIDKGLFIGEPLQSIYGYETEGLFIDQEDIDNYALQNYSAIPGWPRYKDISGPDGEPDGKVTSAYDRKIIGNQFPKYTYGMGITANYKGFDFYTLVHGLGGMESQVGYQRLAYANSYNIQRWHWEERWTPENPDRNAGYPKFLTPNVQAPWGDNLDYWMRNNSFLRIKTVQIGYNIPSVILSSTFIDQFRVYLSGDNIKCFDNFIPGWDPEMPSVLYYPPTRLWSLGVSVQF